MDPDTTSTLDLSDEVVVVTGGSRGIGAGSARRFAALGARVVVSGRDRGALDAVVAAITASGGRAVGITAECTDQGDVDALLHQQDRGVPFAQPLQRRGEVGDGERRQTERGFVEQHERRVGHHGPPDRHHLLLAAAERGRLALPVALDDREQVVHALQQLLGAAAIGAGAHGYVLKDVPAEEVAEAILAVHAGESLIPQTLAPRLLAEFAALSRQGPPAPTPHLTARELEVIKLLAHGKSNKAIARQLVISENTVKNHVRNILDKLQLHSRTEAALYAMRERLVEGT